MSADQLRATSDELPGRQIGEIQVQVGEHGIPEPDIKSCCETCRKQNGEQHGVGRSSLCGQNRERKDQREHAKEFQKRHESAQGHSGVGVFAEGTEQVAEPGALPEGKTHEDVGQADPEHVSAGIDDKEYHDGEGE